MKNVIKTTAAVIALTAVFAGPAAAMVSKGDLQRDILWSINADSNVNVHERNGVVTLTGYFGDAGDRARAIQVAKNAKGVTRVINNARLSN